jgi:hypothetical protein
MTNFISFDVYDIDISKVMNDFNLNFVLLQTMYRQIYHRCGRPRSVSDGEINGRELVVDVHIHFPLYDFWHSKCWPIATWGSRITSFSLKLGCDQRANDYKSELTELGYKIDHHGVANGW